MKNKLKKWPLNWIEHVTETCFLYFEDKNISFEDSKILCVNRLDSSDVYAMRLTFEKYDNIYDIFIKYPNPNFIMECYYKKYYRIRKRKEFEQDFIFVKGVISNGSDNIGLFSYQDLAGMALRDSDVSPYDISKYIESIINFHTDSDDDNEGGENDPIEPFSPSDMMEPELLNC